MGSSWLTMDRLIDPSFTGGMTNDTDHPTTRLLDEGTVTQLLRQRSFCTLATTSERSRPHVAGVLYEAAGTTLYVSTLRSSRKGRNIAGNPYVGVCVPVRRLPVGPPSTLQFQATADILATDDPQVLELVAGGHLRSITGHGELDLPDGCFLRINPLGRVNTYGLGMPLHQLLRNPLDAGGVAELVG